MSESSKEVNNTAQTEKKQSCFFRVLKTIGLIAVLIAFFVGTFSIFALNWYRETWSDLRVEEILYHLQSEMAGAGSDAFSIFLLTVILPACLLTAGVIVLFIFLRRKKKVRFFVSLAALGVGIVFMVIAVLGFWHDMDLSSFINGQMSYSTFIDENYTEPKDTKIEFPEQKRNLIYIFLESMEDTFADTSVGGAFSENVIPNLTQLSLENESFSGDDATLNGANALTGATWTMGAMFSQTSGLPLMVPIGKNEMSTQSEFFPGVTNLGDILANEGYTQELLVGSESEFGGRKLYFNKHGNYDVLDYNYYIENGTLPEDYFVWWGFEDEKLYSYAKDEATRLAAEEEPFNLTVFTVDTHFEDGYLCDRCTDEYGDDQYSNVISCADRQAKEFIDWVEEQPFYENTTIVVVGDHLTMDNDYCDDVPADYQRKVYMTVINPACENNSTGYREYTTFDLFPTTLASLGVSIEGERLGLGTNLFSGEETLCEKYGIEEFDAGLIGKSKLMEELYGSAETVESIEEPIFDAVKNVFSVTSIDGQIPDGACNFRLVVWPHADKTNRQIFEELTSADGIHEFLADMAAFAGQIGEYGFAIYADTAEGKDVLLGNIDVNYNGGE